MAAFLGLLCVYIALFVGTRDSIGADWESYKKIMELAASQPSLVSALSLYGPGYMLMNIISIQLGGGIFLVNLVSAAIFTTGLWRFVRSLPRPLLAITVAIPYLVIVVAMDYARQAAAIGVLLFAFPTFAKGHHWRYQFLVVLAATFHMSAILLGPIGVLAIYRSRFLRIVMALLVAGSLYYVFLDGNLDRYQHLYLIRGTSSAGAILRLAMTAIAGIGWLVLEKRIPQAKHQARFWKLIAVASVALAVFLPFSPSSTALDRVGLYFMPIQMVFCSHFVARVRRPTQKSLAALIIVAFYGLFLATWFATTSYIEAWVPYRSFLL